jgi:hypothetical protein
MKFRILIAVLFFVVPSLSYLSADIYRWTDSKGNVVYGNQPPSGAGDVKLMFREMPSAPDAKPATRQDDSSSIEAILRGLDEETQREEQFRREAESQRSAAPLSREEMIAVERDKLEKKINELEALPLDHFGSQKNKRVRIGYYQYRLETLLTNPDDYFSNPEPFEGNIKTPAKIR